MSYARGELYVYEDENDGFKCYCPYTALVYTTYSRSEMIAHLRQEMWRAMDCYIHDAFRVAVFNKAWKASVRLYEEIASGNSYTR